MANQLEAEISTISTRINGNLEEVLSELSKDGQSQRASEFLDRIIAANSQAAQAEFFGHSRSINVPTVAIEQTSLKGGTVVRTFIWGFHIEISHEALNAFINSADPINTIIGSVGGSIPTPSAPWIALAAAFIAGAFKLLKTLDKGRGIYVSMIWFVPGVFVPTSV